MHHITAPPGGPHILYRIGPVSAASGIGGVHSRNLRSQQGLMSILCDAYSQ